MEPCIILPLILWCSHCRPLANLMPVPEALMLFGELGLMLLVLEAGLDVDLDMLKLIGLRGVAIALTGSLLPLGLGWLLSTCFHVLHTGHLLHLLSLKQNAVSESNS